MTDMEKCTTYKRRGVWVTISCKLGHWEVCGEYDLQLINLATEKFEESKREGKYSEMLSMQ